MSPHSLPRQTLDFLRGPAIFIAALLCSLAIGAASQASAQTESGAPKITPPSTIPALKRPSGNFASQPAPDPARNRGAGLSKLKSPKPSGSGLSGSSGFGGAGGIGLLGGMTPDGPGLGESGQQMSSSPTTGDPAPGAVTNYGRPRKLKKNPPPNPKVKLARRPLPPLDAYKTSYAKRRRGLPPIDPNADPARAPAPPTGIAVVPVIPVKPHRPEEEKPYEPLGVDVGSLRLRPYIEVDGGYDSNPNRLEHPKKRSPFVSGGAGLAVESTWSAHSLKGDMRIGYTDFPNVTSANRPEGRGKIDSRIDIDRDDRIDLGSNFSVSSLRLNSPEIQSVFIGAIPTNRPITWTIGGYLGATHRFNRVELSLRGIIDRTETGDANFSDGTNQYLSRNNYTTVGARPKISYELTPGVKPFVEATIDRRLYDNVTDVNDYHRNSTGVAVRAGTTVELGRQVTGEVAGGYVQRDYEDHRLTKLRGPTVDAALIWTATPLTTVSLRGSTTADETTVANSSGAISRRVTGEISHALLRNLTFVGAMTYRTTDYQGDIIPTSLSTAAPNIRERDLSGTIRADYSLTRTIVVRASYKHQRLRSTVQGADYTSNIFLLGLRLQR